VNLDVLGAAVAQPVERSFPVRPLNKNAVKPGMQTVVSDITVHGSAAWNGELVQA
jgi:hypothetical protein